MIRKKMNRDLRNIIKYIFYFLIIALVIYIIFTYRRELRHINMFTVRRFLLSYGKFAAVMFILIYSLKPVVFVIPASLLSILAGNIFGPFGGFTLSMISCFFAGTLAFYLAKFLGKPFVDKILGGKAMKLDSSIEKNGFYIMLLMRLSFIFPYDGLSYAGGLTKMKYRDFILGTLLGVFPEMVVYSSMGNNIRHPLSIKFILPIILLVIVAFLSYYVYKKNNKE